MRILAVLVGACVPVKPVPVERIAPVPAAPAPVPVPAPVPASPLHEVAADVQRTGDPEKGYDKLVNGDYVSCGIPWTAYGRVFPAAPKELRLAGRTGHNAQLRYDQTAMTTATGVEVVTANCLQCHASRLDGKLVIGLGNANADFTQNPTQIVRMATLLLPDPREKAELLRFAARMDAVAPYTQMATVGANPADNLAAVLFAHRDPRTFAWSDAELIPLPDTTVVPVDVPAWWLLKKKNAMFHVAAGRGDHARTMMAASTLCTDDVDEAVAIDAYMPDIRAYLLSLEAPPWPAPVDAALASQGQALFSTSCARCHGTYGDSEVFPNRLVDVAEVGTDASLAGGVSQFGERFVGWFADSFYGEISRLEPQAGYLAPPLDGIWATAPYLHNGSVPTLAALLDSTQRPAWFTRSYQDNDYDQTAVGWRYQALDHGQSAEPDLQARSRIYDTTLPGYGNGGHTYADKLTVDERRALLEYLKTL